MFADLIQLVDNGVGAAWKRYLHEEMDDWLASPSDSGVDNMTLWRLKLIASERRVLMTMWSANAWARVCENVNMLAAGKRVGLLQTLQDVDKSTIQPIGFESPIAFSAAQRCHLTVGF